MASRDMDQLSDRWLKSNVQLQLQGDEVEEIESMLRWLGGGLTESILSLYGLE